MLGINEMTEQEMIEAVRSKTPDSYTIDGKDHRELVIVRKNSRIVAEYDANDSQRMAELARIYGVVE